MLPYVSLVTDRTIRTRGNELMQCIRLEGVNSTTSKDAHLDRIAGMAPQSPPAGLTADNDDPEAAFDRSAPDFENAPRRS